MVLLRLAISNLRVRKIRSALTVAAIAFSVSLVVSVTSGYRSLESAALMYLNQYLGAADAYVTASNPLQGQIPQSLMADLAADPQVRHVVGRLESHRALPRAAPTTTSASAVPNPNEDTKHLRVELEGIQRDQDPTLDTLPLTAGHWFDATTPDAAVIDQVTQEKLGLQVGDTVTLPGIKPLTLQIVGAVHKPGFIAQQSATLYLPLATLQHFTAQDNQLSRINIDLKSGSDFDAFKARWNKKLAALDGNLKLQMRRDNAGDLDRNLRGVRVLSYLSGAVSTITAMFIIFTALVMGVSERRRTLAMLRAVGATRSQVFRLVLLEAILLSSIGIFIGLTLGILWVVLLHARFSDLFVAGIQLSAPGILFAILSSLLSAIAAGLLPGYTASRLSPLEAMVVTGPPPAARAPLGWAALGIALAILDPLFMFLPLQPLMSLLNISDPEKAELATRFWGHFVLGLPGVILGFFLVAPLLVWLIEKILAPILPRLLALPAALIRQQLSGGTWRSAGTAAALMVGLSSFVTLQVQGYTLIGGWKLPDKFPDIFIWGAEPISWQDQKILDHVPGIAPGSLMPVVITTPSGDSSTSLALAAAIAGQNIGVMFFGVEPQQVLQLVGLEFRDDNGRVLPPDQQAEMNRTVPLEMAKGHRIIVTDEFRQAHHTRVGDVVTLLTSANGPQKYTVCGIVWSPGADVLINIFDMDRMLDQRTAGSVFGSIEDAKRDFGVRGARFFIANLTGGIEKEDLLKNVKTVLGDRGLAAGDARHIKFTIEHGFYRLLELVSAVAVAAMAVASLGVANTVMASVRSRRWQFGILRSLGVCRSELLRLILTESIVLGVVGAVMGTAAGLEMAIDARKLSGDLLGMRPPLVIPPHPLMLGAAAVLLVAILASLWPAFATARTEPLELLQSGRSSS